MVERESVEVSLGSDAVQPSKEYLLGPNDVLYVNVKGHPELSKPRAFLSVGSNKVSGSRVDGLGKVHPAAWPAVLMSGGMTIGQATAHIQEIVRTYLKDPWGGGGDFRISKQAPVTAGPVQCARYLLHGSFLFPLMEGLALGNGL